MKSYGIEKQILLVALIPIMLMAVLLENYVVYSRFSDLDSALLERSQLMAHQLASTAEYEVFSGNAAVLQQDVVAALAQPDVSRVAVFDASEKPLVDIANNGYKQSEPLLAKASKSNPFYQDDGSLILYVPITSTQVQLDAKDFDSLFAPASVKPLGAVIIEISKHRLSSQKHEILFLSMTITLMVLMAALTLAMWAARRISRPIIGMSQTINSFGEGNLDARYAAQPKVVELQKLADGFNQMAQKLQHHHEILETTVAERTSALAASEREYRTLVENTPDTIARYDKDCRRIYVNPAFGAEIEGGAAALLGKKPSENPGGPLSNIYETKIKEVFATGKNAHFELIWPVKDGKEMCSAIRLTAEHDLSGKVISVLGVGHDITELNESKEELNRKELAKSRFLAAAGHDLRQPLAAANLFIDALRYTAPSPEQDKIIQRLDQSMSTFNELLEALLNISKLDAGIVKPEYRSIKVIEIFDWLEQTFAPMAREKQLSFKLYISMKETLVIHSDIDLVKSVLMNLVSNAIKYTQKGLILVSARRRGDNVLFQVWDTGMGIKPEYIQHIFDEFYQVSNQQRDRKGGLGLGLAICKRAISLLGGKVTCRSEFGRGSVFEFRLPLDKSHSDIEQQSGSEPEIEKVDEASFVQGKHFVLIEDDALISEAMCKTLAMMGGKVECFNRAEDALFNARIENDYYIVDYMLGGAVDGIQFLKQVRLNLGVPIKAILMTGDTSPSLIREAEGFEWPVLHKPVNISKLISSLNAQTK